MMLNARRTSSVSMRKTSYSSADGLMPRGLTAVANARRDLFEAMKQVAETGHGPLEQTPSMGCSIKWKG